MGDGTCVTHVSLIWFNLIQPTRESQISYEFLCIWGLFNVIFFAETSSEVVSNLNTSPNPKEENEGTHSESKQTVKEMKRKTKGFKPKRGLRGKKLAAQKLCEDYVARHCVPMEQDRDNK